MNLGDVQIRVAGSTVIARVTGEVDLSNAQSMGQAITREISHEALGLILDLTDLEYLDSAGIQLLYQLQESLQARGQELTLVVGEDSPALDAIRLAGITSHLKLSDSVEQAL